MSEMTVQPYREEDAVHWDALLPRFPMATFLHTRRFLSYHGERFQDHSLLVRDESGETVGLFPAALDPKEERVVVSHPGITYGALLHGRELNGEAVLMALRRICAHYAGMGIRVLRYKTIPHIYHATPAEDDLYALFRLGARRYRCDLSATIKLGDDVQYSQRRLRGKKKADKYGVEILEGGQYLETFWEVLAENLSRRHGVQPVHSLSEMLDLQARFPDNIKCLVATQDGRVRGGLLLFLTTTTVHAQYIASSEDGHKIGVMDALFHHAIGWARGQGFRLFDFGICTEKGGSELNAGLYQFKHEFGAGGTVHEFYELSLGESNNGS